jgi:gliding motility associated protien GldN
MVRRFQKKNTHMNNTLKLLLCISLSSPFIVIAQDYPEDLPWQQHDRSNAKPLEYEYIREADVMWSKKIWRTIDTREKMNLPFTYPQRPLIQILHEAAMSGRIKAYDPVVDNADQFKKEMLPKDIAKIGVRSDTVEVINPVTLEPEFRYEYDPLTWDKITKFKIKEIWYFDSKTASMQARIIGIAPVMEDRDRDGNYRGDMTMYWLYYPDLRDLLAKEEVFNPGNDQKSLSWDDVLQSRMFESYIYKESNVYDRAIAEYATGKDAQLESDHIRQGLFEYEHDLWDY